MLGFAHCLLFDRVRLGHGVALFGKHSVDVTLSSLVDIDISLKGLGGCGFS